MASAPPPPWEVYGAPPQAAPAMPAAPPPVAATPRLVLGREPAPQTPAGAAVERGQADRAPFQTREAAANAEKAETEARVARMGEERRIRESGTASDAQAEVLRVIRTAIEARRLSREGNFTTGGSRALGAGRVAEAFPGSSAADLRAALDTIQGNVAFQRLQQMRQESPTGGAVGNVSDRDLALLSSTIASLDPNQSDERFQQSMRDVIDAYARVYRNLGGDAQQLAQIAATDPLYAQGPHATNELRTLIGAPPRHPGSELESTPPRAPPGTEVAFWDDARQPMPPGGDQFQTDVQEALDRGFFTSADDIIRYGRERGFNIRQDQAEAAIRARANGVNVQVAPPTFERPDIDDARGDQAQFNPILGAVTAGLGGPENVDAAVRGAADTATVGLSDEIAAGLDTAFNGGTYGENLWRQREIDDYDRENNPAARLTGQVAGGFAIPTGIGRATFGAARTALAEGATRGAARLAATQAGARRLGLEGAAYGGGYGFGSSEGDLGDRLAQGGVSALVGGATGFGLGRGIGAVLNRRAGRDADGGVADLLDAYNLRQAAERQGIDLMPADVGGPMTRRLTAGAAQSPVSAGTIMRGAQRTREQGAARLDELARAEGAPQRQEVLGDTAIRAANDYVEQSGTAGREMYREARELSQDVLARAPRAFRNLNGQLRELRATEAVERPLIAGLNRFRDVIADEGGLRALDIDAIRRLRTAVASEARTEGLRGTDYQRRAGQVLDDLREDIVSQLSPEAATAFRRADDAWRERLTTIDGVLNNILGRDRSAEGVARGLSNMATGDSARLNSFLRAIPQDDARIIRGSLIQDLGRATPGQQNAAGDAFSFETFLTNWNRMPERTRNMLFPGSSRRAIEDLALVAEGVRETGRYANRSNSGGAIMVGAGATIQPWLIPAIAANYVTGRMLASPVMVRWLARRPANPAQARAQIQQLSRIARTQPSISGEVLGLQQGLLRQLGESARPLAAESGQQQQDGAN